ncbi:MAG: heme-binding protein [Candidatus Dormibacterales bacterium]
MIIKLDQAKLAVEAAHARAAELGIEVSVAVVDGGGLLPPEPHGRRSRLEPGDRGGEGGGRRLLQRPGDQLADIWEKRPGFFAAVTGLARRPLVPGLGSIPVRISGTVAGAIGVSGGRPDQDHDCARAALATLESPSPD